MSYMKTFTKGLIKENPTLVMLLGLCPSLAVTTLVQNGIGMGLAATFVLLGSNIVISLLKNVIPKEVRLPSFIVIIAGFVTIISFFMQKYLPDLYQALGVFLSLIVVNCIILGRAEMYASKHSVLPSVLDGLGMGVGFTAAMLAMGIIREFFGTGAVFGVPIFQGVIDPIIVFILPPGGFFVFGMLIALANKLSGSKKKPEEIGCAACPMNGTCSKLQEKEACDK